MSGLLVPPATGAPAKPTRRVRTTVPSHGGRTHVLPATGLRGTAPDDPVRRFSRWVRRSFAGTDDASASVIGAWMTAMFVAGAGQRLAEDLARLGHVADGTASSMARAAERAREVALALRSSPTAAQRRHVTASQLDHIRRQLRLETGMISRRLAAVASDDPTARRVLDAVVDAAIWLGVLDLRGAVEELCAGDSGHVTVAATLDAFHAAVGSTLRPRGPGFGRIVRARRPAAGGAGTPAP